MMEFVTAQNPMDRSYYANPTGYLGGFEQSNQADIEKSIGIKDIGQSVTEGSRFGTFVTTSQNAIRSGAGKIELATGMGGGQEPVGAEAYGKDARQALREIFKVNQAEVVSVHSPVQVGNMSGYNPQERGFSDEHRKMGLEEVKKAIDFASDVNGGAVVVHTGEFQRDMSDQPWAKNPDGSYKFMNYQEEPGRAVLYMVDDRTGKLITEVRKSMIVREPEFKRRYDPQQRRQRWVNENNEFIDESDPDNLMFRQPVWDEKKKRFKTVRMSWDDFVERAKYWNQFNRKPDGTDWTPEELFFRSQMETRVLQSRGYSLYHGQRYEREKENYEDLKKAYEFYKSIEDKTPKEEQWKLFENMKTQWSQAGAKYVPDKSMLPSEWLKQAITESEMSLRHTHESSAAADAQAEETMETMQHVVPVSDYAKKQSAKSYAEIGIYAMERSRNNPHSKKDVFVAPENIFPEMGYGSHPEELIELVTDARKEMVEELTNRMIPDPHQRRDKEGNLIMVPNPNYEPGMNKSQAEEEARKHIRATLDTQHLGMWWKHFQPLEGESKEQRRKRFDKWYMEQIDKLEKNDIIGHIHVVDAFGAGHQHLPVGQGNLPVRKALEYLKSKGYKGTMISEGHGEEGMFGQGRILTETLRGLGTPIHGTGYGIGAPQRWGDIQHSYFGATQNPYFIFGAYSPSNDWQLWSQVPME